MSRVSAGAAVCKGFESFFLFSSRVADVILLVSHLYLVVRRFGPVEDASVLDSKDDVSDAFTEDIQKMTWQSSDLPVVVVWRACQ